MVFILFFERFVKTFKEKNSQQNQIIFIFVA